MQISKIQTSTDKSSFMSKKSRSEYENPISRSTEKNLAILGSLAGAGVSGVAIGGITGYLLKETQHAGKKYGLMAGGLTAAIYLLVTLPAKIYRTKVGAFTREKEMDVFSRDRNLKSNLTEEVDKEVQDPDVSLDKKLDDNLKLQMANKGNAIGLANITSQAKE